MLIICAQRAGSCRMSPMNIPWVDYLTGGAVCHTVFMHTFRPHMALLLKISGA
jgi:hypothetical protein